MNKIIQSIHINVEFHYQVSYLLTIVDREIRPTKILEFYLVLLSHFLNQPSCKCPPILRCIPKNPYAPHARRSQHPHALYSQDAAQDFDHTLRVTRLGERMAEVQSVGALLRAVRLELEYPDYEIVTKLMPIPGPDPKFTVRVVEHRLPDKQF
jgi:hypothetical protein